MLLYTGQITLADLLETIAPLAPARPRENLLAFGSKADTALYDELGDKTHIYQSAKIRQDALLHMLGLTGV